MLVYVNKDTNETYSEKAFTEIILKTEQKLLFKSRSDFNTFLMYNYQDLWLDNEFYKQPMHIKIAIRREWFKECFYLVRNNFFRLGGYGDFVEINTKNLDYK